MFGCFGQSQPTQDADVIARVLVIVAMLAAAVMIVCSHWGIAALSVETLIILLAASWGAWHAQVRAANRPRRPSALRVVPGRADGTADSDRPLRPLRPVR